jgi:hypothetical protein
MPIVLKSGSLNLLERSGPVQACNGIAVPLPAKYEIQNSVPTVFINFCVPAYKEIIYDLLKAS